MVTRYSERMTWKLLKNIGVVIGVQGCEGVLERGESETMVITKSS